jgi:hypothetical protein
LGIEAFPQLLTRLEEGNEFFRDLHGVARTRVPADARTALFHGKGAEAPELNPVPPRQGIGDLVEDCADDTLHVPVVEVRIQLGYVLYQLGFRHGAIRPDLPLNLDPAGASRAQPKAQGARADLARQD